ncbi:MAG: LicD family protein [Hungatella sp.]|nr:LicD family protein [Hungatella sp.]
MAKEYDLKAVHQANLKILKEIDRICRKHGIQYMLDAGTLLGAVRHKGFIPWDDDGDVAFTRENYERFARVVRRELPEGMEFLEPRQLGGGNAFYDFTPRILYLNSQTHEDQEEMKFYGGKLNHLWVDLFIQDTLPENKMAASLTKLLQTGIYGLAMGHRYRLDYSKYNLASKTLVGVLAAIGKHIPMKTIRRLQRAVAVKDNKSKSRLRYYSNYQPDFLYVTVEKEWCDEVVDLPFEDTVLMAPKGWHQVLTWIYGDYKKLPPKEKRVPSHSSIEIKVEAQ